MPVIVKELRQNKELEPNFVLLKIGYALEQFQDKWVPVIVKELRQNKELEHLSDMLGCIQFMFRDVIKYIALKYGSFIKIWGAMLRFAIKLCFVIKLVLASTAYLHAASLNFSDAQLIKGFMLTVFGAEASTHDDTLHHVHKFSGPIYVQIKNHALYDHTDDVVAFLKTIDRTIHNFSISTTKSNRLTNMIVHLVDRRNYQSVIREIINNSDTLFLERNACSAVLNINKYTLTHANIFIVVDDSPAAFRHCLTEEILQSLGPVNDNRELSHSIFNDNSPINHYGLFDWYLLNILYDRRIRIGMTQQQIRPILTSVIADIRKNHPRIAAFVSEQE